MDFPSDSVMQGVLDDLSKVMEDLPKTHERMLALKGEAWSDDRMVKVTVGPRGQLVDLEIDPKVFRKPDARVLREKILAAAAAAVRELSDQAMEIIREKIPPEIAELRSQFVPGGDDPMAQMFRTDTQLVEERKESSDG